MTNIIRQCEILQRYKVRHIQICLVLTKPLQACINWTSLPKSDSKSYNQTCLCFKGFGKENPHIEPEEGNSTKVHITKYPEY